MRKTNPPNKKLLIGTHAEALRGPAALGLATGTRTFYSAPGLTVRHLPATERRPGRTRGRKCVKIFAPNIEQRDVVNHLKGSPTEEKRNVLVESARLARGNIQDLAELKASEFDAVIFPGGFGVAKNLCSWAVDGKDCTVNEHVNSTLQAFHSAKKPIGLCCISPVLAAKVFPGCEVTVGQDKNVDGRFPDAETASAIAELGCKHICKNVNESHVDKANKIVTTCAFMCKAPLHEIFDGIGTMVQEVLKLA
ncbi:PREDICTED: ES1 protein homolog, mitochondrial [Corvus brachyrhynchos]|nr:PREDICTED: ES1 protein homolog, mitochondrial [Corvus brachyrhynchos]